MAWSPRAAEKRSLSHNALAIGLSVIPPNVFPVRRGAAANTVANAGCTTIIALTL